jgi:Protein of unknown function DUF45
LFVTVAPKKREPLANLTPAIGASGPHVFAVRYRRARQSQLKRPPLVFAPKRVLEYVVVHELAHLVHRSHGPKFWDFLRKVLHDVDRPKAWLDSNQAKLNAQFLADSGRVQLRD